MAQTLQGRELDAALATALGQDVQWRWWLRYHLTESPDMNDCGKPVYHSWSEEDFNNPEYNVKRDAFERVPCVMVGMWGDNECWQIVTYDLNAMHDVEEQIERMHFEEMYVEALDEETQFCGKWCMIHATAEQRARAALAVLTQ